mmetsp:Transcript_33927/g.73439  ORF Transcript_33927/g.73439 Transcript_33927/m.73439 type:complete len:812 (-) Transcript_33927:4331-6766(-)
MKGDDSSVDTDSAVTEVCSNHFPRVVVKEDFTPFLALEDDDDDDDVDAAKCENSSDAQESKRTPLEGEQCEAEVLPSPKKVRSVKKGGENNTKYEEYDPEPVYRRSITRKCQEADCPNNGKRCEVHGKTLRTCKIKCCNVFAQVKGFCCGHWRTSLSIITPESKRAKKDSSNDVGKINLHSKTKKRKDVEDEEQCPAPSKPPPLLGQTNRDIILNMWDKKYMSIMHKHLRRMEINNKGADEVGREILQGFKANLDASGGMFLKKHGGGFIQVDEEQALRFICYSISLRGRTVDTWKRSSRNIVLHMKDKKYRSIMYEHFRRMEGSKTDDDELGREIFEGFRAELKKSGGIFLKRYGCGTQQIGEQKALCSITALVKRRMDSAHVWRDSNETLKENDHVVGGKRKSCIGSDEKLTAAVPSKNQKCGNDVVNEETAADSTPNSRRTRNSMESPWDVGATCVGATCLEDPLKYIGNYISNTRYEGGWIVTTQRVDYVNYGQVIYRKGVERKAAIEGKDKFTGYHALAWWAYATGYYKKYVVDTYHGRQILKKANILNNPYSIFKDESIPGSQKCRSENEGQRGEGRSGNSSNNSNSNGENLSRRPAAASGARKERVSNENPFFVDLLSDDENTVIAESPPPHDDDDENLVPPDFVAEDPIIVEQPPDDDDGDALPDSAPPVHIKDDDEGDNNNDNNAPNERNTSPFFDSDTEQFMAHFESIQSSFDVAVTDDDRDSVAFYDHLIRYFGNKAQKQDFCLGSGENDAILKAVKKFEDTKEKMERAEMENKPRVAEVFKHLLTHIVVNECKKKLPLA